MKKQYLLPMALTLTSCASMNQSLQMGMGLGTVAGGAATYVGLSSNGSQPKFEDVALGAGIGMSIGLITSYFTHKSVEESRRDSKSAETEMFFGDLPPSPFIFPKTNSKKGGRP
jgi:hypothetical protein